MAGIKREAGSSSERVAANLRRIRQKRGLSYAELARRLAATGYPILDTGLMKIEKGHRRVDVDDLVALALALGVTPNLLLLPQSDFRNPRETVALTPAVQAQTDDVWAWACGERPLGHKAASFTDAEPAKDELEFVAENRRYYAWGGFGWLSSVADWVKAVGEQRAGKPEAASLKVQGSGLIAGAILGAYTQYRLDTADIRAAAESAVMAAIVEEAPEEVERGVAEVWAWLGTQASEDEANEKE